jgi:uncharacterized membrane protein YadS
MPELAIDEIIILIMTIFPLISLLGAVWKNRSVAKWIPGFVCLFLSFVCTNAEALAAPEAFNFFEHFFSMMMGITMAIAGVVELFGAFDKKIIFNQNSRGVMQ